MVDHWWGRSGRFAYDAAWLMLKAAGRASVAPHTPTRKKRTPPQWAIWVVQCLKASLEDRAGRGMAVAVTRLIADDSATQAAFESVMQLSAITPDGKRPGRKYLLALFKTVRPEKTREQNLQTRLQRYRTTLHKHQMLIARHEKHAERWEKKVRAIERQLKKGS